ncbi:hypothetical protein [Enterococcus sp. AZ163]|uniref:hypothetical protein n=1 Tax=Enterococcus sp. AZ163 TaxID=2774638 RepID=UPI003D2B4B22
MNKQDLMNWIESSKTMIKKLDFTDVSDDDRADYLQTVAYKLFKEVEGMISELDESQPIKIPRFIASELDVFTGGRLKEDLVRDICLAFQGYSSGTPFSIKTIEWCHKGNNLRKMIDAIWNDYRVEEPKWVVKAHHPSLNEGLMLFFQEFDGEEHPFDFSWCCLREESYHFTDLKQAEAVAYLIKGIVEPVEVAE